MIRSSAMVVFIMLASFCAMSPVRAADQHTLMPVPQKIVAGVGALPIDSSFGVAFTGHTEPRLQRAAVRLRTRIAALTGTPVTPVPGAPHRPTLTIACDRASAAIQQAVEDESYILTVSDSAATITAPTPLGALHGMETFLQLVTIGPDGFHAPAVTITDHPRFPWRGLMVDVCRHWMPIDVVKRTLDGMAAVKLNVFHWHLSENQGFRVESKRFPKLHEMGSDGNYFTQAQVREVVAYARDRGIRVVPEFDMPGHSTAWFVGYPWLASAPGPYTVERSWGVFDPAMDPTNGKVYKFLDELIGEMTSLFPDPYFHIGGDEVNGRQWNANPAIQAFMKKQGLATARDLQAYFNKRVAAIVAKHGKKVIGWDEILHSELPDEIMIQTWRGQNILAESVEKGYTAILSFGYYVDLMLPAADHYLVEPFEKEVGLLSAEAQARILGGEACMWAEMLTPEIIDSRIWPRTAAIAERFWSAAAVRNVDDMYRRLEAESRRLELEGLTHRSAYPRMLERMTGGEPTGSLRTLADILEPVKRYDRHRLRKFTSFTPLNRLVDAIPPESDRAREFTTLVEAWASDSARAAHRDEIRASLEAWRDNHDRLLPLVRGSFLLADVEPVSATVAAIASIGLEALHAVEQGVRFGPGEEQKNHLEAAAKGSGEYLIAVAPAVQRIVTVAAEPR